MASCEKCWSDAGFLAFNSNVDQATIYRSLVEERAKEGHVCTPAEQCGEMHLVLEWQDSEPMCRCRRAALTRPEPEIGNDR